MENALNSGRQLSFTVWRNILTWLRLLSQPCLSEKNSRQTKKNQSVPCLRVYGYWEFTVVVSRKRKQSKAHIQLNYCGPQYLSKVYLFKHISCEFPRKTRQCVSGPKLLNDLLGFTLTVCVLVLIKPVTTTSVVAQQSHVGLSWRLTSFSLNVCVLSLVTPVPFCPLWSVELSRRLALLAPRRSQIKGPLAWGWASRHRLPDASRTLCVATGERRRALEGPVSFAG